uniref:Laminin G domain-containing protein n=1 Tax=Callorhinchus milii TaxID=7868 RepID=A0A4W3H0E0_CALMI
VGKSSATTPHSLYPHPPTPPTHHLPPPPPPLPTIPPRSLARGLALTSFALVSPGADLNDGQWHSVRLNARRNRVSVILDNNGTSTFHSTTQTPIFSGSSYYFGGCPENASSADCSNGFGNFEGCMRLILIDNQPVDLNLAGQGSQANFTDLHIDVCGILDRYITPPPTRPPRRSAQ